MKKDWKRWLCLACLLLIPLSGNAATPSVAAGDSHTIALKNDGTVVAVGNDVFGQLGLGRLLRASAPVQVLGLGQIHAIAPGFWHTLALKQDGTVWAWGDNQVGQLGDGTYEPGREPVLVVNETINGPLDLIPDVSNSIPPDKIPPFFLATYRSGGLTTTSLSADVRGITPIGSFASATGAGLLATGAYNVYVAAAVPYSGSLLYYQLDASNRWSVLTWPMADFIRGVELGSQDGLVRVNILQNADLSQLIGAVFAMGYGTSPDEMLSSGRIRIIFTVTGQ